MSYYPPYPIIFRISGDIALGSEFETEGRRLAGELRNSMNRGDQPEGYGVPVEDALDTGNSAPMIYRGEYGTVKIKAVIIHNLTYVYINAVPAGGLVPEKKKKCPQLFKCFIIATITKVSCYDDVSVGDACIPRDYALSSGRFWYDVSFCYLGEYVILSDYWITSAGWGIYQKGQYVLLGPAAVYDEDKSWDCCMDERPLVEALLENPTEKMTHGHLDVYPINITDGMVIGEVIHE